MPARQIKYSQVLLTYPQCTRTKEELLDFIQGIENVCCAIICKEDHHETEGEHLHAWIKYSKTQYIGAGKWSTLFDWDGQHGNYAKVTCSTRSIADTVKYVMKDGDTLVWNCDANTLMNPNKSHARKYDNEKILSTPMKQLVDEGVINIKDVPAYERGIEAYKLLDKPYKKTYCRGIWISGRPGCGKSTWAEKFGESKGGFYEKAFNKWWDGYSGEKVVILNDLDDMQLLHYLKIWADKFPCKGEVKGHTVWLHHDWFVVTSNFTIEEICAKKEDGEKFLDAMLRRFKIINVPSSVEYLEWDEGFTLENPDEIPESKRQPPPTENNNNNNYPTTPSEDEDPLKSLDGSGYQ